MGSSGWGRVRISRWGLLKCQISCYLHYVIIAGVRVLQLLDSYNCLCLLLSCDNLQVGDIWAARRNKKVRFFLCVCVCLLSLMFCECLDTPLFKKIVFTSKGTMRTVMRTEALVQKIIRAIPTRSEMTLTLSQRCLKWTRRSALSSER